MAKLYLWGALGLFIFGVIVLTWQTIRNNAAEAERAKQEKANAQFAVQANKGRVNYTTCSRADGMYDFAKGTCQLPATK